MAEEVSDRAIRAILERTDPVVTQALPFPATRCDRVVAAVLMRIGVDH